MITVTIQTDKIATVRAVLEAAEGAETVSLEGAAEIQDAAIQNAVTRFRAGDRVRILEGARGARPGVYAEPAVGGVYRLVFDRPDGDGDLAVEDENGDEFYVLAEYIEKVEAEG